jgi:hypothetical protein
MERSRKVECDRVAWRMEGGGDQGGGEIQAANQAAAQVRNPNP